MTEQERDLKIEEIKSEITKLIQRKAEVEQAFFKSIGKFGLDCMDLDEKNTKLLIINTQLYLMESCLHELIEEEPNLVRRHKDKR